MEILGYKPINNKNITNLEKDGGIKIKLKDEYAASVSIWKFQKRINKLNNDLLNLKSANGKKPEEILK